MEVKNMKISSLGALSWTKNAAKSLGIVSFKTVQKMNPVVDSLIMSGSALSATIRDSVSDIRTNGIESLLDDDMKKSLGHVKDVWKNAKSDLKTGKLYNSERISSAENAAFGFGDDMDDFGDFDDDFGFDDDDDEEGGSTVVNVASNINADNPMVKAISASTEVDIHLAETQMEHSSKLAAASMNVTMASTGKILTALDSINQNLAMLVQFNATTMNSHLVASLKYYDDSLNRTNSILEKLEKVIDARAPGKKGARNDSASAYIFGSDGSVDLEAYGNVLKKNIVGAFDELGLSSASLLLSDPDQVATSLASPLSSALGMVLEKSLPAFFKSAMEQFNEELGAFLPAMMSKLNKYRGDLFSNPVMGILAQIFGTDVEYKTSFSRSKFDRGPRPFDGIAHKALTETIPTQLAQIISLLGGGPAKVMDYKTGKFRTMADVKKDYDRRLEGAQRSSYDSLYEISSLLYADKSIKQRDKTRYEAELGRLAKALTATNDNINLKLDDGEGSITQLLLDAGSSMSAAELQKLTQLIRRMPKAKQMAMVGRERDSARRAVSDFMYSIENDEMGVMSLIDSGFFTADDMKDIISSGGSPAKIAAKASARGRYRSGNTLSGRNVSAPLATRSTTQNRPKSMDEQQGFIDSFVENAADKVGGKLSGKLSFLVKPLEKVSGWLDKAGTFMYDLVFSDPDDETGEGDGPRSFFTKILTTTKQKFSDFFGYLKKTIYEPVREFFFGEKGLVNKFKESEFYTKAKEKGRQGLEYLFGMKDGVTGFRKGGLFSDTFNEMMDIGKGFKSYFTGGDWTNHKGELIKGVGESGVFGEMKAMFGSFTSTMKEYFFGDKGPTMDDAKGVMRKIGEGVMESFQDFTNAIFGTPEQRASVGKTPIINTEMLDAIKQRLPKSLAMGIFGGIGGLTLGGNLGILGSLFLPGGPIGGAILGTSIGFLSQSNAFKDWLFGPEGTYTDSEGNEITQRMGGIINRQMMDFLKKHRVPLIGGAAVGAVRGAFKGAFLPGLLFGGPLGGAIMGMTTSMIFRSEKFQEAMFGKEINETDDAGNIVGTKRVGGLISALTGKVGGFDPKILGKAGTGAALGAGLSILASKFGILGGLMLGPGGSAALGAASAILISSKKWREALFGNIVTDERTGKLVRDGGLLGKFTNMITMDVIQPLKLNMLEAAYRFDYWLDDKIAEPLRMAIEPVKQEFAHFSMSVREGINDIADRLFHSAPVQFIKDGVDKVVDGFREIVFKPFKAVTGGILRLTSKITGFALSAPFRLLAGGAEMMFNRQVRRGLKAGRRSWWEDENTGLFEALYKTGTSYFRGTKAYKEAAYGAEGASYGDGWMEGIRERKAARDAKYREKMNNIKALRAELKGNTKLAKSLGWQFGRNEDGSIDTSMYDDVVDKHMEATYGRKVFKTMTPKETESIKRDMTKVSFLEKIAENTSKTARIVSGEETPKVAKVTGPVPDMAVDAIDPITGAKLSSATASHLSSMKKGSAEYQKLKNAAEEEKEEQEERQETITTSIVEGAKWGKRSGMILNDALGKAGWITLGVLGLVAIIKRFFGGGSMSDLISKFFSGGNGDETSVLGAAAKGAGALNNYALGYGRKARTDKDGNTIESKEWKYVRNMTLGKMIAKGLTNVVTDKGDIAKRGFLNAIGHKVSTAGKRLKKVKSFFNRHFNVYSDEAVEAVVGKAAVKADDVLGNKSVIKKFMDGGEKLLKIFTEKFAEKLPGKLKGAITKAIDPLRKLFSKNVAEGSEGLIRKALAKAGTKGVGSIISKLLVVAGFVAGAIEADRLFGVQPHDVDPLMIIIASVIRGVLELPIPVLWVVDIANYASSEFFGVNFLRKLATSVYSAVIPHMDANQTAEDNKATRSQAIMQEKLDAYNKANNTELNMEAFLDMGQMSLVDKTFNMFTAKGREKNRLAAEANMQMYGKTAFGRRIGKSQFVTDSMGNEKMTWFDQAAYDKMMREKQTLGGKLKHGVLDVGNWIVEGNMKQLKFVDKAVTATAENIAGFFFGKDKAKAASGKAHEMKDSFIGKLTKVPEMIGGMGQSIGEWWKKKLIVDKKAVVDPITRRTVSPENFKMFTTNTLTLLMSNLAGILQAAGIGLELKLNGKSTGLSTNANGSTPIGGPRSFIPTGMKKHPHIKGAFIDTLTGQTVGVGGVEETDMLKRYRVTSKYGRRWGGWHSGVDLVAGLNTPIPSFTDGKVVRVDSSHRPNSGRFSPSGSSYGNYVQLEDSLGNHHVYAHLNQTNVKVGDRIKRGQFIGLEGHTGNSTGEHLHYEVRRGALHRNNIDPIAYLKQYNSQAVMNGAAGTMFGVTGAPTQTPTKKTGFAGLNDMLTTYLDGIVGPTTKFTDGLSSILSSMTGEDTASLEESSNVSVSPSAGSSIPGTGISMGDGVHRDLRQFKGITANELNAYIKKTSPRSPFNGRADVFIKASQMTGLDPRYILAHAALESGWGTSSISRQKNNFFGIGAFDRDPARFAKKFGTGLEAGIIGGAEWIKNNYTTKGQYTLHLMNNHPSGHNYASDKEWGPKIASIMSRMPGYGGPTGPRPSRKYADYVGGPMEYLKAVVNAGNQAKSKDEFAVFEKMVDILIEIARNTGMSAEKLDSLRTEAIASIKNNANVAVVNTGGSNYNNYINDQKLSQEDRKRARAKQVAKGL